MLPRWFRVVLAVEIVGLIAFVVLAVHLIGQGVHAASDALTWVRPTHHAAGAPPSPAPLPDVTTQPNAVPRNHSMLAGVGTLTPQFLKGLNRQTGAFAATEYGLLLDLEALARDEVTRLLDAIHVPSTTDSSGN
jgi:hypothetical protein